jgi:hypothetical protein
MKVQGGDRGHRRGVVPLPRAAGHDVDGLTSASTTVATSARFLRHMRVLLQPTSATSSLGG